MEEEIIWSSEISLADFREDDADLSRICSSDPPGPAHFIHDSCTEVSKPAKPLDDHLNDVDDLRSSQSEPDDSSEIDVILYPRTNPDLSSCDERFVIFLLIFLFNFLRRISIIYLNFICCHLGDSILI